MILRARILYLWLKGLTLDGVLLQEAVMQVLSNNSLSPYLITVRGIAKSQGHLRVELAVRAIPDYHNAPEPQALRIVHVLMKAAAYEWRTEEWQDGKLRMLLEREVSPDAVTMENFHLLAKGPHSNSEVLVSHGGDDICYFDGIPYRLII